MAQVRHSLRGSCRTGTGIQDPYRENIRELNQIFCVRALRRYGIKYSTAACGHRPSVRQLLNQPRRLSEACHTPSPSGAAYKSTLRKRSQTAETNKSCADDPKAAPNEKRERPMEQVQKQALSTSDFRYSV